MLEKILDYQNIEGDVIQLENELTKSGDREKAAQIQQTLKNQHSRLIVLETNAEKVNVVYEKAVEKFEAYSKKLEELEKLLENADPKNVALYEKTYKDFSAVASALEREIANIHGEVQQISHEYEEIIKKSKVDRERFDKFKASYAKLKAENEPKIEALKAKLEASKKQIDPELFHMYQQKREVKKFPVFVPLNQNKCGGCRMEISASKLGSMKTKKYGIIECENCGRYIYSK